MLKNIQIALSDEAKAVIERLQAYPGQALQAVAKGMDRGNELMLGQIIRNRFTGKGPFPVAQKRLGVRTNRLRSSLRRTAAVIESARVISAMGSNVEYFGMHEFGFSGAMKVKAHQRRAPQGDRFQVGAAAVSRSAARKAGLVDRGGKKKDKAQQVSSRISQVKAHTRNVNVPARAPLSTGIEDHRALLMKEIAAELRRSWEGASNA